MTRTSARDRAWIEQVFAAHHRAVLAYAHRRVGADDADEVLAEVFASAWQHRDKVPDPALPWLYRTASNHVLHAQRGHARRTRLHDRAASVAIPSSADHAEQVAGRVDAELAVGRALASLNEKDAEILRLTAWEQLTNDETAYVLGCTQTAARVRLLRARRRFEHALTSTTPPLTTAQEATA